MEIQPRALLQRCPRIASALARLWQDDVRVRLYLDELLVDRRGGRREHSHPKFTTSYWYFVSTAKVDTPVGATFKESLKNPLHIRV